LQHQDHQPEHEPYDLAVIGGGINGTGIARDAAGRGAAVILFEQGDLASGTSSASTKLIHGGLRYLEQGEFRLVREALAEREVLWRLAPHIIWPLRFVLPSDEGLRPRWLVRLGLFLYDHLGGRERLPGTKSLDLTRDSAGLPLQPRFRRAFEYSDCWVEDSRLVALNALDAAERGAVIRPRSRVVAAERRSDHWRLTVESGGRRQIAFARVLVNAAGPWVENVLTAVLQARAPVGIRLVQGSHIVVPRLAPDERAYIFQNRDGRIVFAIPYERDFTLIGTTDRDFSGDPAEVEADPDEIAYLCTAASSYFRAAVRPEHVVWSYAGVRPLHDTGAEAAQRATRDYMLTLDESGAPLLSVFGGKITTYRVLAEAALAKLATHLPAAARPAWTGSAPLPGGDFTQDGYDALVASLLGDYPFLGRALAARLVRAYGTRAWRCLGEARGSADLGQVFGHDLTERELGYLMREEWAASAEDVLWRRSKLGLRFSERQRAALDDFMRQQAPAIVATASEA
jgi:glycerol-3-phosphate dehydrogenase